MKLIKRFIILFTIYLALTAKAQASICYSFLLGDENGLKRAWQEFLLTDPRGALSLNRKDFIESYFVEILVSNYINKHRPDLVNDRDQAKDLISSDIQELKAYIGFKQMLIYAKFENMKQYIETDPEKYRSHLLILKDNIASLTETILKNLAY